MYPEELEINFHEYTIGELNYNRSSWSYPDERNVKGISHHCIVGFTGFEEAEEVASEIEGAEIHAFCKRGGNHFFNDEGKVNKPFSISDILEAKGNSTVAYTNGDEVMIDGEIYKDDEDIMDFYEDGKSYYIGVYVPYPDDDEEEEEEEEEEQ